MSGAFRAPVPAPRTRALDTSDGWLEPVGYDPAQAPHEFARVARTLPGGVCLYDLLMGYWERSADRALVAGLPPLPAGSLVLELGVGTGYLTSLLEQRYPHSQIVGLDFSDEMLGVARRGIGVRRPAAARTHPTVLRRSDVVRGGLEPADCVVSSFLLDLLDEPDLQVVLEHIHGSLRPGAGAHLLALTTEYAQRRQVLGALRRGWYRQTVAGYLACYRSRALRRVSHRLFDYYTHCRPIPLQRAVLRTRLFRISRLRLTSIKVGGVPLLPAQIVGVVPR